MKRVLPRLRLATSMCGKCGCVVRMPVISGNGIHSRIISLLFKGSKSGNYLTIEPHSGQYQVPVAVWAVSARDERNLDRYEGFPDFYYKKGFSLDVKQSESRKICKLTAFAYIMHEERKLGLPSTCVSPNLRYGIP